MVAAAPPEKTSRLPTARTSLVGRTTERAAARGFLLEDAVPLLTLTGPGGVGKTRLALAIAHDLSDAFVDGVCFVDLAPVHDATVVLPAIARVLDVRDTAERPLADSLAISLRHQQLLLVLDNCEQVLDAMAEIAELLAVCPALQVLATSRAPLRLRGEQVLPVPPLALPDDTETTEQLAQSDAVALFVQRARSANPSFTLIDANAPVIAAICRRLDGLPLAIELAAARLRLLSPEALLARLTDRLHLLSGGERDRPDRHRALRDTVAWSYALLSPELQNLFRRLSVFSGGFTIEAATAVAGGQTDRRTERESLPPAFDGTASLFDGNLLTRASNESGPPRYGMLETIREFGLEQLAASGEETAVRDAHAAWCIEIAERSWQIWFATGWGGDWLPQLTSELDNLRSALDWLANDPDPTRLVWLVGALTGFWLQGGTRREALLWLERALDRPLVTGSPRARVLNGAAILARNRGDFDLAAALTQECLANCDQERDAWLIVVSWRIQGCTSLGKGAYDSAAAELNRAIQLCKVHGPQWNIDSIGIELGAASLGRGDYAQAIAFLEEALTTSRARDDRFDTVYALGYLGLATCVRGDAAAANAWYAEAIPIWSTLVSPEIIAEGLAGVATVAARFGSPERSARLFGAADALRERAGHVYILPERAFFERAQQSVRERLGERAYAAAFDAGHLLTLDQAIAEAASDEPAPTVAVTPAADPYGLTPREQEVLALLAGRLTDPEIAEALYISPQTASTHVKRVLGKLGVSNRREAAALAARELPA
jgi:non-specific serine/threonine protein kinase